MRRLYLTVLPLLFALYGVALRARQYASGRSLWLDELAIALNIVRRSPGGLLRPLDHNQGAPLGWLLAEKVSVKTLGANEYALRLVPFVSGVLAIFVFWWVAHRVLPRYVVPVAVGLFAVSPFLVDYSSETKQYSSDVLVGLVLLALSLPLLADEPRRRDVLAWGGVGAVAVWCAHPAAFLLAGFSTAIFLVHVLARRWRAALWTVVGGLVWGLSFVANYLVFLRKLNSNQNLLDFWKLGFLPRPVRPGTTLDWLELTWRDLVKNPVGLTRVGLVSLLVAAGLAALAWRRPRQAALLVAPVLVFVAGAALRAYPLRGRLVLVLVPFVLLAACAVALWFGEKPRALVAAVPVLLAGTLLVAPARASVDGLREPRTVTEIEPALRYLAERQQPGDEVWIHFGADLALRHYGPLLGVRPYAIMIFRPATGPCAEAIEPLHTPGSRVWVVFAHLYSNAPRNERETYLSRFGSIGREVDRYEAPGASVHLVDPVAGPSGVPPVPRPRPECLAAYRLPPTPL